MKKTFFLISVLFSSNLLLAMEEKNSTLHPLIQKYDKNKDGKIFYTEASKAIQDDYIDAEEVSAVKEEPSG